MIAVEQLSASYGSHSVLSEIDLTVGRGTFVGLVGPNGAGKTTLLRTLRGTHDPDSGTVCVGGDALQDLSARRASQLVASVPQSTTLSFDFTVRQTVEMGRTPHLDRFGGLGADDREAIRAAMDRTRVTQFADRSITDVSGGERQRVLLARALAQETPVLLLDEPTGSLDITHAVRTLELVRSLVEDGKTVVAAIHDLNIAARYCDELALLAAGEIRAAGPPEAVLTSTTLGNTFGGHALVTSQPATDAPLVTALAGSDPTGLHVHVVGTGDYAATAVSRLVAAGFTVSVGVVPTGDVAAVRARELDCTTVTVPPFAGIDSRSRERAVELAQGADAVVSASGIGSGNRAVLEAAGRLFAVGSGEPPATDAQSASGREVSLATLPETIVGALAEGG